MQSFNTEQVLWPSYMSLKIGLYKWKHWHNLHYSIANSNAMLYNLDKNVFLKEKSWSILMLGSKIFNKNNWNHYFALNLQGEKSGNRLGTA